MHDDLVSSNGSNSVNEYVDQVDRVNIEQRRRFFFSLMFNDASTIRFVSNDVVCLYAHVFSLLLLL